MLNLNRSLRQGCPLSPYLFAPATVPMIERLWRAHSNNLLKGPRIAGHSALQVNFFADDSFMFLKVAPKALDLLFHFFDKLECITGFQINKSKSAIFPLFYSEFQIGCFLVVYIS